MLGRHFEYDTFIVQLISIKCKIISGSPTPIEHAKLIGMKKENLDSLKWAPADIPVVEKLMRRNSGTAH
jgi:8-oxo-dGTP diphosphatase